MAFQNVNKFLSRYEERSAHYEILVQPVIGDASSAE
jgi:hypothetical protein